MTKRIVATSWAVARDQLRSEMEARRSQYPQYANFYVDKGWKFAFVTERIETGLGVILPGAFVFVRLTVSSGYAGEPSLLVSYLSGDLDNSVNDQTVYESHINESDWRRLFILER